MLLAVVVVAAAGGRLGGEERDERGDLPLQEAGVGVVLGALEDGEALLAAIDRELEGLLLLVVDVRLVAAVGGRRLHLGAKVLELLGEVGDLAREDHLRLLLSGGWKCQ